MEPAHKSILRKLGEHSRLGEEDVAQIEKLSYSVRQFEPNEDLIRQGDRPDAAILVMSGTVGRYHLLGGGTRQYLSFHFVGDLPDAQGLFIDEMDHAVCAMGGAVVAFIPHTELIKRGRREKPVEFGHSVLLCQTAEKFITDYEVFAERPADCTL